MDAVEWKAQKKRVDEFEKTSKEIDSFHKVKDALYYRGYDVYLVAYDLSKKEEVARVPIPFVDLPCEDKTHIRNILYEWAYMAWHGIVSSQNYLISNGGIYIMAKQTLAVKYRPKTFDDVVEQEAIKMILEDQIATGTFQHSYLFCGPAGCGKTTAARIFASEINEGKGNPIEVDAASNNGVDNVRDIIDNSRRKSMDSEYKVYIIDEVHMLSTGAWNAMLKLLEEPPKTTVFIMCTTDPQKIPATILSRVQRYNFSKIPLQSIIGRLKTIINKENMTEEAQGAYTFDEEAISYVAKLADGGMRDAITMMDKCLSLNPHLSVESAVKALGTVDYDVHFDLLFFLESNNKKSAIELVEKVYDAGKDLKQFIKQFQYFVLDVCKYMMFKDFTMVSIPALDEYKQKMEDDDLDSSLTVLEWVRQLNTDIKWEANPKAIVQTAIALYKGWE